MEVTYEEFIRNILETRGRFECGDEYHERHHIIPKCMGGTNDDDNLIDLFAREHFEAHRLLALENPENDKLTYAWHMMAVRRKDGRDYQLSPEEYEEAKIAFVNMISGENSPWYGKHLPDEMKSIISERVKELWNNEEYRLNQVEKHKKENLSEESISNIKRAAKERANQPEFIERQRYLQKQRMSIPTYKEQISQSLREVFKDPNRTPWYGKKRSEETKNKLSERAKERFQNSENHPMFGKCHSEESRQKMSESHQGRYTGIEHPNSKSVICIETKQIYPAAATASQITGVHRTHICSCCNNRRKRAGGFQWKFVYDTVQKNGELIQGAITLGIITEEYALEQLKKFNNI